MTLTYAIEPLLPDVRPLEPTILSLMSEAGALGASLPAPVREAVADLLRTVNTYHSNLIEGHDTRPRDILAAMAGDYAADPERRALQLEARAHVEVQRFIEVRLVAEPDLAITSAEFLCWIHREFTERLPPEYRRVRSVSGTREVEVMAGGLREEDVRVGRHDPPPHDTLPLYLERFRAGYDLSRLTGLEMIAAIPASHHRLLWIHPFLDGNGRVARLFTDAWLRRAGLGAHGLWTASRGLARARLRYLALLEAADAERWDAYDGRGARSVRALTEFCAFFLDTCLDQVRYMRTLLDPATLAHRIRVWVAMHPPTVPSGAEHLLVWALNHGTVPRGDAARITGTSERTARRIVRRLTDAGLLVSATPKGPLRLAFPASVLEYFFPLLTPPADPAST